MKAKAVTVKHLEDEAGGDNLIYKITKLGIRDDRGLQEMVSKWG